MCAATAATLLPCVLLRAKASNPSFTKHPASGFLLPALNFLEGCGIFECIKGERTMKTEGTNENELNHPSRLTKAQNIFAASLTIAFIAFVAIGGWYLRTHSGGRGAGSPVSGT